MDTKLIEYATRKYRKKNIPELRAGDVVRVHQKVEEGSRERIQVFEGIVVRVRGGRGTEGSFMVRKVSAGIGIERNFPLHLPSIIKIEKLKRLNLRKARVYYLRDLTARQLKKKTRGELENFVIWEEEGAQEEEEKIKDELEAEAELRQAEEFKKDPKVEEKIVVPEDQAAKETPIE